MIFLEDMTEASRKVLLDDVLAEMSGAEVFELAQSGKLHAELGVRCEMLLEVVDDQALLMLDDRDRAALAGAVGAL